MKKRKKLTISAAILMVGALTVFSCSKEINSSQALNSSNEGDVPIKVAPNAGNGDGQCAMEVEVNPSAESNNVPPVDLTNTYIAEHDILPASSRGLQYIEDYYVLSEYAIETGSVLSNYMLHYDGGKAGVEVCNVLVEGSSQDIVFTQSRYQDLMNLATFYENAGDAQIEETAIRLKGDLEENLNRTKAEVLAYLAD